MVTAFPQNDSSVVLRCSLLCDQTGRTCLPLHEESQLTWEDNRGNILDKAETRNSNIEAEASFSTLTIQSPQRGHGKKWRCTVRSNDNVTAVIDYPVEVKGSKVEDLTPERDIRVTYENI
nr:PREDICTED: uncharacterized protein LOC106701849 [Latimeria chalumnae]|eukprot:XP_014339292.1 PREDICTED: uncharacterized protein LOC106701849 [Latimeria chalumnae]